MAQSSASAAVAVRHQIATDGGRGADRPADRGRPGRPVRDDDPAPPADQRADVAGVDRAGGRRRGGPRGAGGALLAAVPGRWSDCDGRAGDRPTTGAGGGGRRPLASRGPARLPPPFVGRRRAGARGRRPGRRRLPVLRRRDEGLLAEVEASLAALGGDRAVEPMAPTAGAVAPPTARSPRPGLVPLVVDDDDEPRPRRRRRRWLAVVGTAAMVAGVVLLVVHLTSPRLPGETATGSVKLSQQRADPRAAGPGGDTGPEERLVRPRRLQAGPVGDTAPAAGAGRVGLAGVAGRADGREPDAGRRGSFGGGRVGEGRPVALRRPPLPRDNPARPEAAVGRGGPVPEVPGQPPPDGVDHERRTVDHQGLLRGEPAAAGRGQTGGIRRAAGRRAPAARPRPARSRRRTRRRRRRRSTSRPRGAASGWGRRPWPRAPARARATPTSRPTRSGRRCRPGRAPAGPARPRRRRCPGRRGGGAGRPGRRRPRDPVDGQGGADAGRRSGPCWPSISAASRRPPSADRASAAAPKPTMPGTFSMPARRARSCWPPTRSGSRRRPRRSTRARRCRAGPPSLWAADRDQVGVEGSPGRAATCPAAAAASTWTSTPASRASSTTSATGWRVPTSWLAHWQCTRAGGSLGVPLRGRRRRVGVDPAAPSTGSFSTAASRRRGVADGRVLDVGAEDRRRPGRSPAGAPDRGVDRLGGAGGEDDLAGPHAEQARHLLAGLLDGHPDGRPSSWTRPGSADGRSSHGRNGLDDLGPEREVEAWSR